MTWTGIIGDDKVKRITDILDRQIDYAGGRISVRQIEETIHAERSLQDAQVSELKTLRARNDELQEALEREVSKLREISDHLSRERQRGGVMAGFREIMGRLPWFSGRIITRNSIEELLRSQYELSARRVKEAAEFADRLEVARVNLYDEMERLNARIVESARNEELARDHVAAVRDVLTELEARHATMDRGSADAREVQAKIDQARRVIAEHAALLKLYSTAEDRLDRLKENTRQLAETISYLRSDITLYVTAASEKLDMIAGQIQAIGAAADASVVMLELKHSLDSLTESVNYTSQFVAETQAYFRQNVDQMIDDLELYDDETVLVFEKNLAFNEMMDELRIEDAMTDALARKIDALAEEELARAEVELAEHSVKS